jgi:hypothetical protein
MGPCNAPSLEADRPFVKYQSLHECGADEAQKHKWIESEKAGRDLGDEAVRSWVSRHWNGFLRERWVEHLQGKAFWVELDHDDFGLLQREFRNSNLLQEILRRVICGGENLDILNWAIDEGLPIPDIFEILEAIDINSRRIECQFAGRLARII